MRNASRSEFTPIENDDIDIDEMHEVDNVHADGDDHDHNVDAELTNSSDDEWRKSDSGPAMNAYADDDTNQKWTQEAESEPTDTMPDKNKKKRKSKKRFTMTSTKTTKSSTHSAQSDGEQHKHEQKDNSTDSTVDTDTNKNKAWKGTFNPFNNNWDDNDCDDKTHRQKFAPGYRDDDDNKNAW
eukprot:CAMPEP_0202721182 /NCGR_PEP_ID=MMETSP1385-20130828/146877_1 /ASSEMBLY_ACC=CAM_ASM_000861 /TAXON_ID=933848 /ORGANISM="Elphidium margaritaceum" /LENGTH=182 /DNA_ID=CAMNT_0049385299 /DNA_START=279 /DNA_END=824 /DNA_ORIENTATION=-